MTHRRSNRHVTALAVALLAFASALAPVLAEAAPTRPAKSRNGVSRAVAAPRTPSGARRTATLVMLRGYTAPDHTRLVADISGANADDVRCDSTSVRGVVTVHFTGMTRGDAVAALSLQDGLVRTVAVDTEDDGVRVTITLDHPAPLNAFTLDAADGRPSRFVLDILRPVSPQAEAREDSVITALKSRKVHIIALDAGHGGEDYGAIGKGRTAEKNVTLAVVESLATRLNAMPGFRAVLTRKGDYFVPLRERTRIARRSKADLFMSVHCNASVNRQASGTEVYFLSPNGATDELARATARRENEADLVGGLAATQGNDVGAILLDLAQTASVERSSVLAENALDQLATSSDIPTRGVKQAGFVVLKTVDVPSILVETAFISNPREEQLLADPAFQAALAHRLALAIRAYFTRYHAD